MRGTHDDFIFMENDDMIFFRHTVGGAMIYDHEYDGRFKGYQANRL